MVVGLEACPGMQMANGVGDSEISLEAETRDVVVNSLAAVGLAGSAMQDDEAKNAKQTEKLLYSSYPVKSWEEFETASPDDMFVPAMSHCRLLPDFHQL